MSVTGWPRMKTSSGTIHEANPERDSSGSERARIQDLRESLRVAPVPRARALAAERLGQAGTAARPAVGALLEALGDVDPGVRSSAAEALDRIGHLLVDMEPELRRLLRDRNPEVRLWAALAFEGAGLAAPDEALMVLESALLNGPAWRVQKVCKSLAQMGVRAVPALVECFLRGAGNSSSWARQAVVSIGHTAVPELIRILRMEPGASRELLWLMCEIAPIRLLVHWLGHKRAVVRTAAAVGLHQRGEAAILALPALLQAIRDPNPSVRLWVAAALLTAGPQASAAIPELIEALDDPVPQTRRLARHTLLRLCH